jgi:hypothetical protein
MRAFKRRGALGITAMSIGVVALLGVAISPAGNALRPLESQALQALRASRPVIDAAAANCAVSSSGACIEPSASLGSTFILSDRIAITGQVTATCGPFLSGNGFFSFGQVNLAIDQPAGHEVAHASRSVDATCDGAPHTYTITATAFNAPFHPGTAVATGSVFANGEDFSFNFVQEDASVTQTVAISKR